jgi:hypothetical protein
VARFVPIRLCLIAIVVGVVGTVATVSSGEAVKSVATVRTTVGPTRLVSPGFGYSVAYRTVSRSATVKTEISLFVYENGRWRNAVAGRSKPLVQVTTDGGRRWRMVVAHGLPSRPCSVTSVSAASATVAWVVARGRGYSSGLFQTSDGGRTWHRVVLHRS